MSTAVVFGANGISGIAILKELTSRPDTEWRKIIALSRRAPVLDHKDPRVVFKSVDLLGDARTLAAELKTAGAEEATHVFYYAYIAKEDEQDLIDINRDLFENAIAAVEESCPKLKVFSLQTGYKYYGCHLGGDKLNPYPWKEDTQRHSGSNFYFVQEDMLVERAKKNGWKWIVTRPNFILGTSKGNFMSLAVTVALYATARKALGEPLVFPGSNISFNLEYDHSIATNNAAFQLFAAQNDKAYNQAFNIHDGKSVTFAELWPKIAAYFSVSLASPPADEPGKPFRERTDMVTMHSTAEWAKQNQSKFPEIANKLGLDPKVFEYATWDFIDFALSRTWPDIGSLDRARRVGWDRTVDSFEEGYKPVFDELKKLGIIPK